MIPKTHQRNERTLDQWILETVSTIWLTQADWPTLEQTFNLETGIDEKSWSAFRKQDMRHLA